MNLQKVVKWMKKRGEGVYIMCWKMLLSCGGGREERPSGHFVTVLRVMSAEVGKLVSFECC